MIGALASWPIAVRIAISGFIGVTASLMLLLAGGLTAGPSMSTGSMAVGALRFLAATIVFLPFGLVIAGPLIIITIVAGVLLRRRIERRLLSWSLAAPFVVWVFVCVMDALLRQNHDFAAHDFGDRLAVTMREAGNLLMFFGAFVSGLAFYALSVTRNVPPTETASDMPVP